MTSNPHNFENDGSPVGESSTELPDKSILCIDCNQEFVWTTGERTFFQQKGLTNPPKRCKPCKKAKNDRVEAALSAANGQRQKVTVSVECAACGRATTVPFYPSQGRPVLCRDCFRK
ncbi:MAG: zinc-ribbon domain containing protein [Acidobacteria bacterium]|nr:zinc-ribbon domain containing protein [Acidobacteriota bacterium]